MNTVEQMNRAADNIRILVASMVEKAKSGHPGGAMGGADFVNVLFAEYLRYDPENPLWSNRDRFFLDPGHMAPMLYAQLCLAGKFNLDDLQALRQWGSPTPGHPERCVERGVENASGPLGQGHVFAVGAAIAAKWFNERYAPIHNPRIYAYISDGGIQEEISQGAGRIAGHLGLDNLIMFYDANEIQLSTRCNEVSSENIRQKYEAWGWFVQEINGHDVVAIRQALDRAIAEPDRPSLIVGHTIMAKGCVDEKGQSAENTCSTHGQPISKAGASFAQTIKHLGGDPQNPFVIFDEVKTIYDERAIQLKDYCNEQYAKYYDWQKQHPQQAEEYERFMAGGTSDFDWQTIKQKNDISTRSASAVVLSHLAQEIPNMIVASADLSASDKTDGFLKQTHPLRRKDFSGQFLQAGVSELTMSCLCIGMSLHGGIIPACATFFVFSDYMKPAVRMAALMQLPVIFIWSHDSFRVGEDGPTHEPVEQEAQIRLMEKLKNHAGRPSMLVLRPADAAETTMAWRMALENTTSPTALILSRQDIISLPPTDFDHFRKGAYIVQKDNQPQITLLASGSEVSVLVQAADILRKDDIHTQIVSVPSEGQFREQPMAYQKEVLPDRLPRFGLTAGLPITMETLVQNKGRVYGLESFGFSAPFEVLEEKLGFTPDHVAAEIKKTLEPPAMI